MEFPFMIPSHPSGRERLCTNEATAPAKATSERISCSDTRSSSFTIRAVRNWRISFSCTKASFSVISSGVRLLLLVSNKSAISPNRALISAILALFLLISFFMIKILIVYVILLFLFYNSRPDVRRCLLCFVHSLVFRCKPGLPRCLFH